MDFTSNRLRLLILLFSGIATPAWGGAHYAPQTCTPQEIQLIVKNTTDEDEPFWIQIRDAKGTRERAQMARAGSRQILEGRDFLVENQSFSVRQRTDSLHVSLRCKGLTEMTATVSPHLEFPLPADSEALSLRLLNLHHGTQTVRLIFRSPHGEHLEETTLDLRNDYVSLDRKMTRPRGATVLVIQGEARLTARLIDLKTLGTLQGRSWPAQVRAPTETAYFLVASTDGDESYVLPVRDPEMQRQARSLIAEGSEKIVFTEIEPAPAGSENRDLLNAEAAPWSWRVKAVLGFNDLGHQDCSGSPSMVEDFKENWMPESKWTCFWTFHLKRELSATEVAQGRRLAPQVRPKARK